MPPSSRRATRPRKAAEAAEVSDAETPDLIATPSRTSRKRARGNNEAASNGRAATRRKTRDTRAVEREDTEGTEPQDNSDAETEPSVPAEVEVISKLKVADKLVHATEDYSNALLEGKEHVPGYGKIAGRNWTFIIQGVEVNIGRPEQHERPSDTQQELGSSQPGDAAAPAVASSMAKSKIDIDLGPDRQISRLHAIITYDGDQEQWYIIVNGRNGIRLDTVPIKRGAKAQLRSGSVIDICGTQMAFITTSTNENDGPSFAESIIRQTYNSEEDEPNDGDARSNGNGHARSGQNGQGSSVRRPQHPSSAFRDGTTMRFHPQSQPNMQQPAPPFQMPGTPVRNQALQIPTSRTKPSPASAGGYSRGVMIESTESIDYAHDQAKDLKPPHSYAQLIGMAILSTPEQQMTLNNIYKWIMSNYAFYRFNTGGWQNSIRHNLSLNKAFEKIARRTDEPGKGMKWMIAPKERDTFLSQGMKGCRRPNTATGVPSSDAPRGASDPSSPAQIAGQSLAHARLNGAVNGIPAKSEHSASPPMSSYNQQQYPTYPTAQEAYTPDRGSRRPGIKYDDNDPDLVYPPSAKSTLNHLTAAANAAGSPPSLYVNEDGRVGPLDTPFPVRSSQKLAPPSTLQRPSAFMEFSSPAPFWKFGSTPLRPLGADMSPLKTPFSNFRPLGPEIKYEEDHKDIVDRRSATSDRDIDDMPVVQSSSPPRPGSGQDPIDASPTRSIPRPATSHSRSAMYELEHTQSPIARGRSTPFDGRPAEAEPAQSELPTANAPPHPSSQAPATAMRPPSSASSFGNNSNYTTTAPTQQSTNSSNSNVMNSGINGLANAAATVGSMRYSAEASNADDDDGIDLAKGFQPIGAFHKMGAARFGLGMAGR
ncbi:hypothetical protein AAFC00_002499 [Neodothiora populina]|uniref:Uncharacterized protein n=1 Tax=Neodothiora populina TaxID=2781224 RepID=A0ABR3P798_9PEZI